MSTRDYSARFNQSADVIFTALADAERHHRIVPFCKSVAVIERRAAADGSDEIIMEHRVLIERIAMAADVRSTLRLRPKDRVIETVSVIGNGHLKSTGRVTPDGTGSQLLMQLDISNLPLRYRLLLIDPILRRAHEKFIEKLTRRAAQVAGLPGTA
jgi:ribosome-associated toxin RatA of RatAB toxin-antitoxin module